MQLVLYIPGHMERMLQNRQELISSIAFFLSHFIVRLMTWL